VQSNPVAPNSHLPLKPPCSTEQSPVRFIKFWKSDSRTKPHGIQKWIIALATVVGALFGFVGAIPALWIASYCVRKFNWSKIPPKVAQQVQAIGPEKLVGGSTKTILKTTVRPEPSSHDVSMVDQATPKSSSAKAAPVSEVRPVAASSAQPTTCPFTPIYTIGPFCNDFLVNQARELAKEMQGCKFFFHEQEKILLIGYDQNIIKALAFKTKEGKSVYPTLSEFIGSFSYNVFGGYSSRAPFPTRLSSIKDEGQLTHEAQSYFSSFSFPQLQPLAPLPPGCREEDALLLCLKDAPGICIGDAFHEESSPKEFLCKHLKFLVQSGVTTLYIEHLTDTLQDELTQYLQGPSAQMPEALSTYLDYLDQNYRIPQGQYGFKNVIPSSATSSLKSR
jgi:hypothetical protein